MRPKRVLVKPGGVSRNLLVEKFFDAAIALEICRDKFGSFLCVDAELLREAEGREAVNHAEIDDFGDAAVLGCLRKRRDAKHFLRRAGMNVFAATKSFDEHGILGEMRENAQFDLRIIGGKQQIPGSGGESGADFAPELGADRDVL